MKGSTFITRVVLRNYKSIAACDVRLQPLTFLVGANGAGKSNFLDALRFVADALNASLDHALRNRGGIHDVRRRSGGHPNHFSIRLDFVLPEGAAGYYAFRINVHPRGAYKVQNEVCMVQSGEVFAPETTYFRVNGGTVTSTSVDVAPAAASDRLYLVNASGLPEFRPVYEVLSHMGFYRLNPDKIRNLQVPEAGDMLTRDGSNLTSVLSGLSPTAKQRVEKYLAKIVPGIRGVRVKELGHRETLEFRQDMAGAKYPWRFLANNMSDGTLRGLGILVALFQGNHNAQQRITLVGIEEPEITLHPAAISVLLDGFRDAADKTQIVITSHSPYLLDDKGLNTKSILAVEAQDGNTIIAQMDKASKSVLRDKLFTTGELLRLNQLQPDAASAVRDADTSQLQLFDFEKGHSDQSGDHGVKDASDDHKETT
ncbi:AAA family ATPase [Candidatus Poribacteria bacterium]|nr:AAA family ATPase [Candidatus Poribacteria bacterium]